MISAPVEILQAIYLPTGNYFCKTDCLIRAVTSGTRCVRATFSEASLGSAAGSQEGRGARRLESRSRLPSWPPRARTLWSQPRGHPPSKSVTALASSRAELFPRSDIRAGRIFLLVQTLSSSGDCGNDRVSIHSPRAPFCIVILCNSRWTQGLGVVPTAVGTACEDPMGLLGALYPRTDDPSRSLTPGRLTDCGHASWFLALKGPPARINSAPSPHSQGTLKGSPQGAEERTVSLWRVCL